jgi:subtilase family serine protease
MRSSTASAPTLVFEQTPNGPTPKLAVGAAQSTLVSFVIPLTAPPATYSFVACADGLKVVPEVDENNNCVAVAQTVNVPGPDLQVTSVTNKAATLVRGGVLSIADIVANAGPVNAGATRLEYYLSAGGTRILFGSRDVPALAAGKTSRGSVTAAIAATVPVGTYTVLACADVTNLVVETNEGNNCLASASQVTVK